ncbi:MAG: hypothetical protein FRX48_05953 [Lasallia pustulata]|uniref:UBC core domain-containing protein n=1 Tax=Lasallia pustulata TaxID=136370 RepID=A0A5M8PM12_9LECA|nr:MAG: hypothetical protein FRX48_05953 [Lasallia pustulata]
MMVPTRSRGWGCNSEQQVLLEFGSLKHACPDGIYLSLTPDVPMVWSGVLFVRKGPYMPAILRFEVAFPLSYPALPPTITFATDIFHPLVTPLTTYTYTTGSTNLDTVSATDEERLPPGCFSLRHGFPHWFDRREKSAVRLVDSSGNYSGSPDGRQPPDGIVEHLLDEEDSEVFSQGRGSPIIKRKIPSSLTVAERPSIIEVLRYMKSAFDDEKILNILPLEAAGNPGAWRAWQAHKRTTRQMESPILQDEVHSNRPKQPGEWSWDGVWLERVKRNIDASTSEPVLYAHPAVKKGKTRHENGGDDLIHFLKLDDATVQAVREKVAGLA